ncbi:hypothetical protein Bca52824_043990 [Brassica carinata]|uniref:Uncharacterized protein n=1 Tax=Brassica carinata TaxID=52824 RepID=A0A8X7V2L0_BRACI|nr:hypothetical protein Bca52824_043990 [Brassica carinata]
MAKSEISSTLRHLKVCCDVKEEKKKKIDEEPMLLLFYWDPQPGALLGRMSFQSFNPSIEKLNEEALSSRETDASPTSSSGNGGRMSFSEPKTEPSRETNGDLKRKQSEEQNHPSKFPRSSDKPSPSNKKEGDGFKKPKSLKEVWSVLKPPKQPQTNKGSN